MVNICVSFGLFACVSDCPLLDITDITESSLQKSFLESGMHYFRGYDKEGHNLCMFGNDLNPWTLFTDRNSRAKLLPVILTFNVLFICRSTSMVKVY